MGEVKQDDAQCLEPAPDVAPALLPKPAEHAVFRGVEYREIAERVPLWDLLGPGDRYAVLSEPSTIGVAPLAKIYSHSSALGPSLLSMLTPEMHIAKLVKPVVCISQILIHSDRKSLLADSFRKGDFRTGYLRNLGPRLYGTTFRNRPSEHFQGRYLYLDGAHVGHFGHFLKEVLPRMWAHEFLDMRGLKILMAEPMFKPRVLDYLRPLGFEADDIQLFKKAATCDELIIARQGCALGRYLHPLTRPLWRRIGGFYRKGGLPKRVFISRRGVPSRVLMNEDEIEAHAVRAGFVSIQPEKLSIPEQIALFHGATHMIGAIGSNNYNALFAGRALRKLILRPSTMRNVIDHMISHVAGGSLAYVEGEQIDMSTHAMLSPWKLDATLFAEALDDWVARPR